MWFWQVRIPTDPTGRFYTFRARERWGGGWGDGGHGGRDQEDARWMRWLRVNGKMDENEWQWMKWMKMDNIRWNGWCCDRSQRNYRIVNWVVDCDLSPLVMFMFAFNTFTSSRKLVWWIIYFLPFPIQTITKTISSHQKIKQKYWHQSNI